MRPNFALTLSEDRIGLLHRAKGGWRSLGEASLDDPGLTDTLRLMRETAQSLSDGPLRTKLVIPDSLILYTTQPLAAQSKTEQRNSLRRTLDGLTPYAVDDLVFDWTDDGDTARLAVVARETLEEAESFAKTHDFDPVCFVAAPQDKSVFEGEPFFGPTDLAQDLLDKGQRPQADTAPAHPGTTPPRPARAKPAAPRRSGGTAKATPQQPKAPAADRPAPVDPEPKISFASRRADTGAAPATVPPPPAGAKPPARFTLGTSEPTAAPTPDTAPRAPIAQDAATAPEKTGFTGIRPKPGTSDSAVAAPPQVEKTDAPAQPWPKQPKVAALAPKPEKRATDTLLAKVGKGGQRLAAAGKGMPAPAETLRSATRLAHRARTSVTGAIGQARQEIAALATRLPDRLPLKPQRPATPSKPRAGQPRLPKLGDTLTRASAALQRQIGRDGAAPTLGQPGPGDRKTPPQSAAAPAPKPTQKAPKAPTAPAPKPADPLKREANPKAPGAVVPPAPRDEAEALTVFGARRTGAALQPRQRIRPALMAGVAVLAFAGVAGLWALFFLGQDAPTDSPPQIAALPEQPPVPRPQETLIAPPPVDIAETPVQPRVPLSPEQAAESYAATGLWQRAPEPPLPPTEGRIDALYLPRPDSAILPPEKVALPDPAVQRGNDTPPSPQTTARGGAPVVAMPAATEPPADAPQIAVTAGPPPVVPPDRPAAVLGRTPPDGAVRPRLRPAELAPAIPEDTAQPAAALPAQAEPDTGTEPDIRPADRPDALLPPAEDTQATETPEDEAAAETPEAPSSELALARSPLPLIRPAQLSEELAALAPAVPAAAAATAPSIPTSASVAKQATVPSAINLRKVSLIGVYGTESDRRALVRLPTGQYVKVQVGDNIDGGQVAAIGADSLRYIKAGRSQLLELPGG